MTGSSDPAPSRPSRSGASVSSTATGSKRSPPGFGNNGRDGTEGARRLNAYGTYLHGSLLPKNPWLTDQLILNALRRTDDSFELEPLDDTVERSAFESMSGRLVGGR